MPLGRPTRKSQKYPRKPANGIIAIIATIVWGVFSSEVQTGAEGRQKFTGTVWLKADENFWGL